MAENKRIPVKWIRDKAKAAYEKDSCCYICETKAQLELHHLNSITLLLERWCKLKGYGINTDEEVLLIRDEFIEAHHTELYDQVYTLCNEHHVKLHGVYGKIPPMGSATRQANWIQIQRDKLVGKVQTEKLPSPFKKFIKEKL